MEFLQPSTRSLSVEIRTRFVPPYNSPVRAVRAHSNTYCTRGDRVTWQAGTVVDRAHASGSHTVIPPLFDVL